MKEKENRMFWKILVLILKIIFAIPAVLLFALVRCLQFFLKFCGTVVSFVCILSAVVVSMGAIVEILLQIRGNGPGIPAIILTMAAAGGLFYVPAVGVAMVMVVLEAICSWLWKFYMGILKTGRAFTSVQIISGLLSRMDIRVRIQTIRNFTFIILKELRPPKS